jgi:hypothetical protein
MSKKKKFDKIAVSVNGKRTAFKIGDYVKFFEGDTLRCITRITIDSDGCVSYMMTFVNDGSLVSQWITENDFKIMASLDEAPTEIGFK